MIKYSSHKEFELRVVRILKHSVLGFEQSVVVY